MSELIVLSRAGRAPTRPHGHFAGDLPVAPDLMRAPTPPRPADAR